MILFALWHFLRKPNFCSTPFTSNNWKMVGLTIPQVWYKNYRIVRKKANKTQFFRNTKICSIFSINVSTKPCWRTPLKIPPPNGITNKTNRLHFTTTLLAICLKCAHIKMISFKKLAKLNITLASSTNRFIRTQYIKNNAVLAGIQKRFAV